MSPEKSALIIAVIIFVPFLILIAIATYPSSSTPHQYSDETMETDGFIGSDMKSANLRDGGLGGIGSAEGTEWTH